MGPSPPFFIAPPGPLISATSVKSLRCDGGPPVVQRAKFREAAPPLQDGHREEPRRPFLFQGGAFDSYDVLLIKKDGTTEVSASH